MVIFKGVARGGLRGLKPPLGKSWPHRNSSDVVFPEHQIGPMCYQVLNIIISIAPKLDNAYMVK